MSKCPGCGSECEQSMKFCMECGTAIPQTKECPMCRASWPLTAKFCAECGYNFNAAKTSRSVIGDKNVIAGDVHIDNSQTVTNNIVNNITNTTTTTIINQDETKKVVQCVVCGRQLQVTDSAICQKCHQYVCTEHYNTEWRMCENCAKTACVESEELFFNAFDGINPELQKFAELRDKCRISDERLLELLTDKENDRAEIGDAIRCVLKDADKAADLRLLARMYEVGAGSYVSIKRAILYYRRAARLDDRYATERLAALNTPVTTSEFHFDLKYGSKGVSFGREVFESASDLFGLTPEEKSRYEDPANCKEHMLAYLVDGNEIRIKHDENTSSKHTAAYEVVLVAAQNADKIKLIKTLREATGLGLKEAKEIINSAPARLAVFAFRTKADALCGEFSRQGATAEVRETNDFSPLETCCGEIVYKLNHRSEKNRIHYIEIEGEGPFRNVLSRESPDRTCLYVARDMIGEMVFHVAGEDEFDEDLLDVYLSHYYGEGGVDYTFLDHLEYAGRELEPWHADELADMGEGTHACHEGSDAGFEAFDLKAPPTNYRKVRFEFMADWIHVGCEKATGWDRLEKIRHREISNYPDDHNREVYALVGSRLRVIDLATSAQLADLTLDTRSQNGVVYEQCGNYFEDWLVNFSEGNINDSYLIASKRYVSRGLCSERVMSIKGDFDPAKLVVKWQALCPYVDAVNPAEILVDPSDVVYDDKPVVCMTGTLNTPSAQYAANLQYVKLKDRGMVDLSRSESWLLTKNGREKVDLWGTWANS